MFILKFGDEWREEISLKSIFKGVGDMAQQLRILTDLSEDLGSVSRTFKVAHSHL